MFAANIIRVAVSFLLAFLLQLPLGLTGIQFTRAWLPLLIGVILFVASYFSIKAAYSENVVAEYLPVNRLLGGSFWEMVILLGVFVPFGEELFFRGLVQNLFTQAVGIWPGVLLSVLVFVAVHYGNVVSGFETKDQFRRMLLGRVLVTTVLCWLYLDSQSIWLPIFLHALQDLGTYLILYRHNKNSGSQRLPESFVEEYSRTDV